MTNSRPLGIQWDDPTMPVERPQEPVQRVRIGQVPSHLDVALTHLRALVERFETVHHGRPSEFLKVLGDYVECYGRGRLVRWKAPAELLPTIRKLLGVTHLAPDYLSPSGVIVNNQCKTLRDHYKDQYPND